MAKISDWFSPRNEIHRRYDQHGLIQVFDHGSKRYLSFGTADEQCCQLRQSPAQLQHPYSRAMLAILSQYSQDRPPDNLLLLGLGGGGLAQALLAALPHSHLQAIELRPAVVHVARQYFGLPRKPEFNITIGDALEEIRHIQQPQDIIFSDLYLADGLVTQQLTQDFMEHCHQQLTPGGWLVFNLWREHRDQQDWFNQLNNRFDHCLHSTTKDGNWIIWAQKSGQPPQNSQQAKVNSNQWSPIVAFNLWQSAKGFYR